jgi:protein O-mannosyl-transferase
MDSHVRADPRQPQESDKQTPWVLRWPILALLIAIIIVYFRIFSGGFVGFDDDMHVYANPFLNPPTLQSVANIWQQPYEKLYVPLAYSIFAAIARFAQVPAHADTSIGHAVSLDPVAFHVVSIAFHVANVLLCFLLVRRLTRRTTAGLLCSLVFALHPLQLESVGWISELRGLSSTCFALMALGALVLSRQAGGRAFATSRNLLVASTSFVVLAMLCKPAAAVLPLVALAIDRIVLGTPWRRAIVTGSIWAAVAVPFGLVTRSLQAVSAAGESVWWQRPFIAGDALAFYLFKTFVPIDLCVDYGRTPHWVMSHAWGYVVWAVPVGLLIVCYRYRDRRPLTWLGALLFVTFLLPTLGLVPFSFQAYSTVADRYAYLALMGVGLMVADAVDYVRPQKIALRVVAAALVALAVLTFSQSRYWVDSSDFLHHTIDVNPDAAFAYNNLGDTELANGDFGAALADYQACVERDPSRVKAYINLAEVYSALNQPAEAQGAITRAVKTPVTTADDFSNLGIVLMKMNQPDRALQALSTAVTMEPRSPTYLFNQANALSAVGQFDQAEATFRRCLSIAPSLAGAHTGLGIVLAETHRLAGALDEFRTAVRLQPHDPVALDDLKKAEDLMAKQGH